MSLERIKIRFESQFCHMNCQIFSWGLSSGGTRRQRQERDSLLGILRVFRAMPAGLMREGEWRERWGLTLSLQSH